MPKAKYSKNPPFATTSSRARTDQTGQDKDDGHSASTAAVCCRVCMSWDSEALMVQLFSERCNVGSENGSKTLAEVLAIVGGVQVPSESDKLPQVCCVQCRRDVEAAFKLRTLCQSSDSKLRELHFEQVVVKKEYDDGLLNPLEVEGDGTVCKPDVETLFPLQQEDNDDEESRNEILLPKVEIYDEEPDDSNYLMESDQDDDLLKDEEMDEDAEDLDSACSDKDENEGEDSAETSSTKPQKLSAGMAPDVYETIPLEGIRCCGCKNVFDTDQELLIHAQTAHIDGKVSSDEVKNQCDICYKVFRNARTLRNHKKRGNLKNNFRCKACGEVFISRTSARKHYLQMHRVNPTTMTVCCGCTQKFETMEALKSHSDAVHTLEKLPPNPERPVVCEICYRNFATIDRLHAHRKRQTRDRTKTLQCVECGKTFERADQLRVHEAVHRGVKLFQCPHCPKSYCNKDSFRKHRSTHNAPDDKYQCTICGRCLSSKRALEEHLMVHSGERPLECPHCPATFARSICLRSHIVYTHIGERKHACEICDKRFSTNAEKTRHVRFYHEKQKPYPCFFCPRGYPRKDYRKRHMVSAHPNEMRANPIPASELGEGKYELPPE